MSTTKEKFENNVQQAAELIYTLTAENNFSELEIEAYLRALLCDMARDGSLDLEFLKGADKKYGEEYSKILDASKNWKLKKPFWGRTLRK